MVTIPAEDFNKENHSTAQFGNPSIFTDMASQLQQITFDHDMKPEARAGELKKAINHLSRQHEIIRTGLSHDDEIIKNRLCKKQFLEYYSTILGNIRQYKGINEHVKRFKRLLTTPHRDYPENIPFSTRVMGFKNLEKEIKKGMKEKEKEKEEIQREIKGEIKTLISSIATLISTANSTSAGGDPPSAFTNLRKLTDELITQLINLQKKCDKVENEKIFSPFHEHPIHL